MGWKDDHEKVQPVMADIGGNTVLLPPKIFKSGSLGWYGQKKGDIDDTRVQIAVIVTVIGSKGGLQKTSVAEQMNKTPGKPPKKPVNASGAKKGKVPIEPTPTGS